MAVRATASKHTSLVVETANNRVAVHYRATSTFGATGSGSGEFASPTGVALSASRLLAAVADTGNNRIQVWQRADTADTTPWNLFGNLTGPGNEPAPVGVALSGDACMIAATFSANDPVVIFTCDQVGGYVYSTRFGSGLSNPSGLAISTDTLTIYVADTDNDRVSVWSRSGASAADWSQLTTFGQGTLDRPSAIAVTADGLTALVVDSGNDRVVIWSRADTASTTWAQQGAFGGSGSGQGQLSGPTGIAISADALTAWVSDTGNNRISVWTRATATATLWANSRTCDAATSPAGIAVGESASNLTILTVETSSDRVAVLYRTLASFGASGSGVGEFSSPGGVAVSANALLATVADTGNNRIQVWQRISDSDATAWTPLASLTGPGNETGPVGVAMAGDASMVAVTFSAAGQVVIYEEANPGALVYTTRFGSGLGNPTGIALSADKLAVFIADTGNNRISMWARSNASAADWSEAATFGTTGSGVGNFSSPTGVAIAPDGLTLFVADTGNDRVSLWYRTSTSSSAWAPLRTFGASGGGAGKLDGPGWVAVAADSLGAWVSDAGNDRITFWTRPGTTC